MEEFGIFILLLLSLVDWWRGIYVCVTVCDLFLLLSCGDDIKEVYMGL